MLMSGGRPQPHDMFELYGMDERGAILLTEFLQDLSPQQLQRRAEERLKTFAMVEVCQGTTRVLFLERRG